MTQRHNTAQRPLGTDSRPEHLFAAIQRLHRRLLAMELERVRELTPEARIGGSNGHS